MGDHGLYDVTLAPYQPFVSIYTNDSFGGAGDYIHGGPGHDFIMGQQGADTLAGGQGEDDITGMPALSLADISAHVILLVMGKRARRGGGKALKYGVSLIIGWVVWRA